MKPADIAPVAPPLPSKIAFCVAAQDKKLNERESLDRILELWKARKRSDGEVVAYFYSHVDPILQEGPTCGIVALAMVASLCTNCSVRDIFQMALVEQYTLKGEILSAFDMFALAQTVVGEYFEIKMISNGLKAEKRNIIKHLSQGSMYLIPYDADKDHSPGLFLGHRAHWALLCGYIDEGHGELTILARQGKSKLVGIWGFDELHKSNANLVEISPHLLTGHDHKVYDIGKTLAGHGIQLDRK